MTAKIIDGLAVARQMRQDCRRRVEALASAFGCKPGLAVILVGENPASLIYVRNKIRACEEVGIRSLRFAFPESVPLDLIIDQIRALNDDPSVHGILVQLPLPPTLELAPVLGTISVDKRYVRSSDPNAQWPEYYITEYNAQVGIGGQNYFLSADGLLMPARKDQPPPDLRYFKPAPKN